MSREISELRKELDRLKSDIDSLKAEEEELAVLQDKAANDESGDDDDEYTITKKELISNVCDMVSERDGYEVDRSFVKAVINETLKQIEVTTTLGITVDLGKFGKFELCNDFEDDDYGDIEPVYYVNFEPGSRYIKEIANFAGDGVFLAKTTKV